jgi:hypothetical protein
VIYIGPMLMVATPSVVNRTNLVTRAREKT